MFAALALPLRPGSAGGPHEPASAAALLTLAREFSPRVECVSDALLALDMNGFGRWFDSPRALGAALRGVAADRGLAPHVAVAGTRTAALVSACGRAGLTVVPPGEEATCLAPLPLRVLAAVQPAAPTGRGGAARRGASPARAADTALPLAALRRWGLRTLGELAALPAAELSERLGQAGVVWQRLARGGDLQPLVPVLPGERFEESFALEWPVETLEPLSFVLGRLFEALCVRLEQADRGVAILHVRLDLVLAGPDGRRRFARTLQLPAPMRDARTLRTLALLDLESHPPPAAVDRVTVAADVVEGRVLQLSLLERAMPAEHVSTLLARLSALAGADRVGAPALVDSHRPGAFAMTAFTPAAAAPGVSAAAAGRVAGAGFGRPGPSAAFPGRVALRRFRHPVPARVEVRHGRPVRVTTERRHVRGGDVVLCAGPWRTSGAWWEPQQPVRGGWDRDEWDVSLAGGARYLVFCDRLRGHWFIEGMLD